MEYEDDLHRTITRIPWSSLRRADVGTADSTLQDLLDLATASMPESRDSAAGNIYCAAANQGALGEVSPFVVDVLVAVLRFGWCQDREPIYYILQAIHESRGTDRPSVAAGHELFVKTRTKIVDALDVYLGDLRSVELQDHPSLLLLLEDLAASRITVIASLDAAMGATPPPTQGLVREALDNAIEHARQHVTAPDECYCGEYFSLSEEQKSVALSVVK